MMRGFYLVTYPTLFTTLITSITYGTANPKTALIDPYWTISGNPIARENRYISLKDNINLIHAEQPILGKTPVQRLRWEQKPTNLFWKKNGKNTKLTIFEKPETGTLLYTTIDETEGLAGYIGSDGKTYEFNNNEIDSMIIREALGEEITSLHAEEKPDITQSPAPAPQQTGELGGKTNPTTPPLTIPASPTTLSQKQEHRLSLKGSHIRNNTIIEQLLQQPETDTVKLIGCPDITNDSLIFIASNCPNLQKLYLVKCPGITNEGLQHLPQNITSLFLRECQQITDEGLNYLPSTLTFLDLTGSNITDQGIDALSTRCPNLALLNLYGCSKVTNDGISHISRLENLRVLNIKRVSQVNSDGLIQLLNLKQLSTLTFTMENRDKEIQGHEKIEEQLNEFLPEIQGSTLTLYGVRTLITDNATEFIRDKLQQSQEIKTVRLLNCSEITAKGTAVIAETCSNLTELIVDSCSRITEEAFEKIANHCSQVTKLKIRLVQNTTDEAIEAMVKANCGLQKLSLIYLPKLTNKSIETIAENCHKLSKLRISSCDQLTSESISHISKLGTLKKLSLRGTYGDQITDQDLTPLKKLKHLKTLILSNNQIIKKHEVIQEYIAAREKKQ